MTDIDTSALTTFVEKKSAKKKPEWAPLDLSTLHEGMYLACDQSFTAAGLVWLCVWPGSVVRVMAATTISSEPGEVGGWESDYGRAEFLQNRVVGWIVDGHLMLRMEWSPRGPAVYLHEAPPIGGGKFVHPEVSLLAGYAFRQAMRELVQTGWEMRPAPMVRRQDHAKLICGNANATKPVHHRALKELFPQIEGSSMITNEATRDALSIALTAAYRGSRVDV